MIGAPRQNGYGSPFPDDYRRASKTNVEVNTAVQTPVVCTEEEHETNRAAGAFTGRGESKI
jgi:hypothetical protein